MNALSVAKPDTMVFRLSSITLTSVLLTSTNPGTNGFITHIPSTSLYATSHSHNIFQHQSISKWNEEYTSASNDDNEDLITKEMFLRDMISDESARRKKKGSKEYKPHDNRDALPFIVRVKTPDPYTKPDDMLAQAKRNSEMAKKNKKSKIDGKKLSNLVGMDGKFANAISASIYSRKKDGTLYKVLGQFELDKNTNCGDLIEVGEREFEVVTARSQFK